MFTLKIKNTNGEIFELSHNTPNYAVVGVQGLTRPHTIINTSVGGGMDGTFFNSARVEQRNIVIDIVLNGDIEENRQRLYRIFPQKTACTVYFKNKNRDVKISGYVEVLDGDLFSMREAMQISIICPRPFWQDMQTIYRELSNILKMFQFPFFINATEPIPFSEHVEHGAVIISNTGDIETGFICNIAITAENPQPTLTQSTVEDTSAEYARTQMIYVPMTAAEYNPETDTLNVFSSPSEGGDTTDKFVTLPDGVRYIERTYETPNSTGTLKQFYVYKTAGKSVTDMTSVLYRRSANAVMEYTTVPEWYTESIDRVQLYRTPNTQNPPPALADWVRVPDSEFTFQFVDSKFIVTLNDVQNDNQYGLWIGHSKSGIDIHDAEVTETKYTTYRIPETISQFVLQPTTGYDRTKDLLRIYEGEKLRTDYTITPIEYEGGGTADFIQFENPVNNLTYEIFKSVSGEDIRDYTDTEIDEGFLKVNNLKIYNTTTQQFFGLDTSFELNDTITVNSISGQLGVTLTRNGVVSNLLNYIAPNSSWLKLAVGENQFTFTTDTNADFVNITFETALQYGGV